MRSHAAGPTAVYLSRGSAYTAAAGARKQGFCGGSRVLTLSGRVPPGVVDLPASITPPVCLSRERPAASHHRARFHLGSGVGCRWHRSQGRSLSSDADAGVVSAPDQPAVALAGDDQRAHADADVADAWTRAKHSQLQRVDGPGLPDRPQLGQPAATRRTRRARRSGLAGGLELHVRSLRIGTCNVPCNRPRDASGLAGA